MLFADRTGSAGSLAEDLHGAKSRASCARVGLDLFGASDDGLSVQGSDLGAGVAGTNGEARGTHTVNGQITKRAFDDSIFERMKRQKHSATSGSDDRGEGAHGLGEVFKLGVDRDPERLKHKRGRMRATFTRATSGKDPVDKVAQGRGVVQFPGMMIFKNRAGESSGDVVLDLSEVANVGGEGALVAGVEVLGKGHGVGTHAHVERTGVAVAEAS